MKAAKKKPATLTEAATAVREAKEKRSTFRIADLDPEDQAALREGIAAFDAGEEGVHAEHVIAELRRWTEAARARKAR